MNHLPLAFFLVGLVLSAILAYPIFRLLIALKSRQTVSQFAPEGHQLKQGTPTMGGIIVVVGIILTGMIFRQLNAYLVLVILFAAIGFVDDYVVPRFGHGKRGLGWKQKLLMEIVAAAIPIALLVPGGLIAGLVAGFLVLFFANAYNFADGQDGLAAGLGFVLFGSLWCLLESSAGGVMAAAAIGGLIPFAILNRPPAKVFMGDVGSLPLGALIGFGMFDLIRKEAHLHLSSTVVVLWILAIVLLSFVMIAELIPVPMQIFWVKVFKKKLFPYTPIHHAFEKKGWKEVRVTAMFILVQLGLAVVSIAILMAISKGALR